MADQEFNSRAAAVAAAAVEEQLIEATRAFEDASRQGDEWSAGDAMRRYAEAKRSHEILTGVGAQQQQRQPGQLSNAQRNFLSRRSGQDNLTAERMNDYANAHTRAIASGLRADSPEYFAAIEHMVDHQGDGRQPILDQRTAAKISGLTDAEYSAQANKLAQLKRMGYYQD